MDIMTTLNTADSCEKRLSALRQLRQDYEKGTLPAPELADNVNNHIHTIYSFSPYSPAGAVFSAWKSGLSTAGIMDHDSVAGCREFIEAGSIFELAVTVGFECRCSVADSPFESKYINNPDQRGIIYASCHGIPHQNIYKAQYWLDPYRLRRVQRITAMADNINRLLPLSGIQLDAQSDILPISQFANGGSVTERHLLCALARKIIAACSSGKEVAVFLHKQLGMQLSEKNLQTVENKYHEEYYEYYLLGILKGELTSRFYIEATGECPDIREFLDFTRSIGAIPAYPYLGDVGDSVTGDKKTQEFEDSFLDQLVPWLKDTGFRALTYMPTRNTEQQLQRLIGMCSQYDLFQICGEDINTPFQSFICEALRSQGYKHLIQSTWALIGHERAATLDEQDAMFSVKTIQRYPDLEQRIQHFAELGRA